MSMYDMSVYMPLHDPVIVYPPIVVPDLDRTHHIRSAGPRTGGRMRAGYEPIYWGGNRDVMMLDGSFRVPLRGWQYKAFLTLPYVTPNDYGLLNEWALRASPVEFYPYGLGHGHIDVYIHPESMVWHHEKSSLKTAQANFELVGTKMLYANDVAEVADIIDPSSWSISVSGTGPWSVYIRWLPLITAGQLIFQTYGQNDILLDEMVGNITARMIGYTVTDNEPVYVNVLHSLSGFAKRMDI